MVKLLGGKCCKCGYTKNLGSLCFHHTDPNKKVHMLRIKEFSHKSFKKVLKEAKKCIILYHNCHNEVHHPNLNNLLD